MTNLEPSLNQCEDNVQKTIGELLTAIYFSNSEAELSDDERGSVEFYLEPDNGLYFTSPNSSAVKAQNVELLRKGSKPFRSIVNNDIITTYLSSGDLVLVSAVADQFQTLVLGAVDRSTGLGMYHAANWLAADELVVAMQALTQDQVINFELNIKEIYYPHVDIDSPQVKRSRDRLMNLLQDCRAHTLSLCSGLDVEVSDAEE